MSIFDKETQDKANNMGGNFIKATEFEGEGLNLRIDTVEKVSSQYGGKAEDSIVEHGVLEEGQSFRYTFTDKTDSQRKHDSASMPMFIGFHQADVNLGDFLNVKREGKVDKTRYHVTKIEPFEIKAFEYPEETVDPKNIPF